MSETEVKLPFKKIEGEQGERLLAFDSSSLTGGEGELLVAFLRIIVAHRQQTSAYYNRAESEFKTSPYREAMVAIYKLYQNSRDWKHNHNEILERAGGKCERCGEPATIVHHKDYQNWALGEEELLDLEAVCRRCHSRAHGNREVVTPFFAQRSTGLYVVSFLPDEIREKTDKAIWL